MQQFALIPKTTHTGAGCASACFPPEVLDNLLLNLVWLCVCGVACRCTEAVLAAASLQLWLTAASMNIAVYICIKVQPAPCYEANANFFYTTQKFPIF